MSITSRILAATLTGFMIAGAAHGADDPVLNLYSARHYQSDQDLYKAFTDKTGIEIRVVEGKDAALLERVASEGPQGPADVLLLADASRLWKAEQTGLFVPLKSTTLESRIPAHLRGEGTADGTSWFGFSTRARVIVYNKKLIDPADVKTYADLAKPSLEGMLCTRTGSHPYMLSLLSAQLQHNGLEAAEAWASAAVANFARKPRGGDTDQIRATAIGECGVALTNSYYFVRLMRSSKPADQEVIANVGMIWPDQDGVGTHINVSGGGLVRGAPNPESARKFLEFLASDFAQKHFAEGNNEWPVVEGLSVNNEALNALGTFKSDPLPLAKVGAGQVDAAKIVDRVRWR